MYTADNQFGQTPESRVFVNVWEHATKEYMREFNYMAECANLNFDFNLMHDNVNFKWNGFNDSMPNYINETVEKMIQMKSEPLQDIFDQVKEKLLSDWKNEYLKQSYQQAFSQIDNILFKNSWQVRNLRHILETYSYEQFTAHLASWFQTARFVWLITGNISKDAALDLIIRSKQVFQTKPVQISDLPSVNPVRLPPKQAHLVESPLDDKTNENSCTLSSFEVDFLTDRKANRVKLLN